MNEGIAHLAMAPDGLRSRPDDGCDELFGSYRSGPMQRSAEDRSVTHSRYRMRSAV